MDAPEQTHAQPRKRSRLRRVVKVVLFTLLGIALSVLVLALAIARFGLQAQWSRDLVRDQVTALVSDALGTRFHVERIETLSAFELRAHGVRLEDDHGSPVATVEQLHARINPFALSYGKVSITSATVERAVVELGTPLEKGGGGLLGVFERMKASQPPEPETEEEGSSIALGFDAVTLREVRVAASVEGARYEVEKLDGEVDIRVADAFALGVSRLSARVLRDGQHAATLRSVKGRYDAEGASHADVTLEVVQTQKTATTARGLTHLALRAKLEQADDRGAQALAASAQIRQLSSATAATFGVHTDILREPVDLKLDAKGDTRDLRAYVELATPGGRLQLKGQWLDPHNADPAARVEKTATLELYTGGMEPARFLGASGIAPFALQLRARAKTLDSFANTDVDAQIAEGHYDGIALPSTEIDATYAAGGPAVVLKRLQARYPDATELTASGSFAQDRSLRAEVRLRSPRLGRAPPVRKLAPDVDGSLALDAKLSWHAQKGAVIDATVLGERLQLGEQRFERVSVRASGGPTQYALRGELAERGSIDMTARREGERWRADGTAMVAVRPNDWLSAMFKNVQYAPSGLIAIDHLHADYRGAKLRARGQIDPKAKSTLRIGLEVPNLVQVTEPFMATPLEGSLNAEASVGGRLEQPEIALEARYARAELAGLKDVVVQLEAQASVLKRSLELAVDARAKGAEVHVQTSTKLHGRTLALAALERGEHDVKLVIERLPLTELQGVPRDRLAMRSALLQGEVHVQGTLEKPKLEARLRSDVRFLEEGKRLEVSLDADYEDRAVALKLRAVDEHGPLFRTQVETALAGPPLAKIEPERMLIDHAWAVEVWLGARRLDEMPLMRVLQLDDALLPARVAASGKLAYEPGEEPRGDLKASMLWPPAGEKSELAACGVRTQPRVHLEVTMQEGKLHAQVKGGLAKRTVVTIDGRSDAPIGMWLQPKDPQPVSVEARFADLRISELPMLCEHLDGRISGVAEVERAVTQSVTAKVELKGSELRWGKAPLMNASISAHADKDQLIARATLKTAGGTADVSGSVPLDIKARVPSVQLDAPAKARIKLDEIELAALLGPIEAVSAREGTLDGDIAISGTLREPRAHGSLAIQNATLVLPEVGQPFERVNGKLELDGRTIRLGKTRIHDRDGVAEVSGEINLDRFDAWRARAELSAENFPIRRSGVILAELDGNADVEAKASPNRLDINVQVGGSTRIELSGEDLAGVQSLTEHKEIIFLDEGETFADAGKDEDQEESGGAFTVLRIEAPKPFWMRRDDFSVLLTAKLRVELGRGPPSVSGRVGLERGVIELLGQMFDIERGSIELVGGNEIEPVLNLTASKRTPGGEKVTIEAQGSIRKPTLRFLIDDSVVTAGEALAAATGTRTSDDGGSSVQDEIGSAASGIAAGVLTLGARRELGEWVPVLAFEDTEDATTLRAGVGAYRLIPKFMRKVVVDAYVEGIFSSQHEQARPGEEKSAGSTTEAAVLLELRYPYDLLTEMQYGPGPRWSIDLGWEP
jgi:autotransporter translocation and assembly factor TamB